MSSLTWMGSLKSTLSTDTVTHGRLECRMAHTAATRSTSERTTPPNTLPMTLACCGIISSAMTVSDSRGWRPFVPISSPPVSGCARRPYLIARLHAHAQVIGEVAVEQPDAGVVRHHVGHHHPHREQRGHVGPHVCDLDGVAVPVRRVDLEAGRGHEVPAHVLSHP